MKRTLALTALALGTLLTVSGCSAPASSDDTEEPTSSASAETGTETETETETETDAPEAAPADGETLEGDGYSYAVPAGWTVPGDGSDAFGTDTMAADTEDTDGFADNVNVVLSPAGAVSADQVETAGKTELESVGATEVTVQERLTVADSETAHLSASLGAEGVSYLVEQYYLTNDDQTYVITFSFSDTVSDDDRTALADSVLATWTWS